MSFSKVYETGPMVPHCESPWVHAWHDDAPHKINPHNEVMEICIDCMAKLGMGPEVDHVNRIVSAKIQSGEMRWRCQVPQCEWLVQVLPTYSDIGRERARLHAMTHTLESSGAVLLTGEIERLGDAEYGQMPDDDWDYDGGVMPK